MGIPEGEQVFTAKIDRISSSGNGIVKVDGSHLNIGPIKPAAVGKEVKVKKIHGQFGACLYKSLRADRYLRKHPSEAISEKDIINLPEKDPIIDPHSKKGWKHLDYGEEHSTTIHHTSKRGDGIIRVMEEDGQERSINIGSVVKGAPGERVRVKKLDNEFGVLLDTSLRADNYLENHPKRSREQQQTNSADEETSSDHDHLTENTPPSKASSDNSAHTVPEKASEQSSTDEQRAPIQETETGNTSSDPPEPKERASSSNDTDLLKLRDRAEEASVEEVPTATTTTRQSKPEYSRSGEIKEYVKARADGYCEGCGDPAPFISATGDPYLHAHHIYELSDGGSDTPDTVIALCPNCHYRVHHGEDGEEYNEELLEVVQEKEQ